MLAKRQETNQHGKGDCKTQMRSKARSDARCFSSHCFDATGVGERELNMHSTENQIIVYQPNEVVRLDVWFENETVWLTQAQLCELFGVVKSNISYHLKSIFAANEMLLAERGRGVKDALSRHLKFREVA